MESFNSFSKTKGLTPDALLSVISQIESREICMTEKIKLMTCLIPQVSIPEEAFIRMTCLLCDFKLDLNLKVEILKWMNSVYSFVDNLSNFINLIGIFFRLLECKTLQPYICALLFKMTRPEHATVARLNRIGFLVDRYESQLCLHSLMFLYCRLMSGTTIEPKQDIKYNFENLGIYPSLIKEVHPSYDTFIPAHYVLNNDDDEPLPPFCIRVEKISQTEAHPTNEKSLATQPDVSRFSLNNPTKNKENDFLEIYKEFECMKKQKIEKILQNKYIRLFFSCHISQVKKTSVEDFVLVSMYSNLKNVDFLCNMLKIFHEIQKSVPGVCDVAEKIIEQWDGSSGLDIILEMLTYEPLCCFEKFQYLFDLIIGKLLNSSVYVKYDLLSGLSNLYQEWVLRDQDFPVSCQNCNFLSDSSSATSEDQSVTNQIHKLGNYIVIMFDAFLLDDNFCMGLLNEILLHNERVSRCHLIVNNLVMHPLSTVTFHSALFTINPVILESLCRLMVRYQEELECMRKNENPESHLCEIYFQRYSNDILQLLLKGEYKSKTITHLSREKVIPALKAVYPKFEKHFKDFKHPALTELFIKFCGMDNSFLEIKNNPQACDYFSKCLQKNGQEFFVKFLKGLMSNKRR